MQVLQGVLSPEELAAVRGALAEAAFEDGKLTAGDAIKKSSTPTPDERARLDAYAKAEAVANGHRVREPLCALGDESIIDGDETYAALAHPIDPPEAAKEARAVIELLKKTCGATH